MAKLATANQEDQGDPLHARWCAEIKLYEKEAETWEKKAKKIVKRYKDEREAGEQSKIRFNVLWSNVNTLQPAAYARNPKPDIERRFRDADKIGRVTSEVLQRSAAYFVESYNFGDVMKAVVKDRLLAGRGSACVRYKPHFRDMQVQVSQDTGVQVSEDATKAEPVQEITYEEVCYDYIHYGDYGHTCGRVWDEVGGDWRRVYMTRQQLKKRFPNDYEKIPLDHTPKNLKDDKGADDIKKASIYEIHDKESGEFLWLHKDYPKILDRKPDPLRLKDFFPGPKPLYATLGNDSLIPTPDYIEYQDQATELDMLTARIASLTKSVKVVGVYDASAPGIEKMLAEGFENTLIPVESWAVFAEKGGMKGAVEFLPLDQVMAALLGLYEAREKVKQDLYEITGISDIIRGATNASETATAQQLKGQFASLRLDELQSDVQRFARDLVEITAQIIAEHFQLDTIKKISGVRLLTAQEKQAMMAQLQVPDPMTGQPRTPSQEEAELLDNPTWEEVEALLRDDAARNFRINIETDSTIKMDEQAEQQARTEFLSAVGQFLTVAMEVGTANPAFLPLLGQMLAFGTRGFRVGKEMESAIEVTLKKLEQIAANPQPQVDPAMEKLKQEGELKKQELEQKDALERERMSNEYKLKEQAQNNEFSLKSRQMDDDRALADRKLEDEFTHKKEMAAAAAKPTTAIQLDGQEEFKRVADTVEQAALQKEGREAEMHEMMMQMLSGLSQAVEAMQRSADAMAQQAEMTNKIARADRVLSKGPNGEKRARLELPN